MRRQHTNQRAGTARQSHFTFESLENRILLTASNPAVITMYVGYTAADVKSVGSAQLMNDKINRGVQLLNQTLANSKVAASVRLLGTIQSNYTESGDGNADLTHLSDPADPQMADLKAAAQAAGADVTDMVVTNMTGLGGITNGPFNMILLKYLDNGVLTHEFGHTLGGGHGHDMDQGNTPAYAYEAMLPFGNRTYEDAIGGGLNYFSNPNVFFRGVPTGVGGFGADAANNALVMNQNVGAIAALKTATIPDTTGPTAELGSVWADNAAPGATSGTLTFEVVYTDGSGVNVASLGNNNLTVSGPNGFSAPATLVSVDDPSVNYGYHLVTYQVTTPGPVGDLGGYSFAVNANSVADTVGNFTPAGPPSGPSPLSPDYAGSDGSHAAEIGDLAGRSWRVTDEIGQKFQMNYYDPANYHFSLSQPAILTVSATKLPSGSNPMVAIWNDLNGNLLQDNGEEIQPTGVNTYTLAAGQNYYINVSAFPYGATTVSVASNLTAPARPAPSTLSGTIFNDTNNNGVQDTGEAGLPLAAVRLGGTDASGNAVSLFAYADAGGGYAFANVPPSSAGGYTLTELPVYQQNAQLGQGTATAGTLGGTANGNTISGVVVAAGSAGTGYTFANLPVPPAPMAAQIAARSAAPAPASLAPRFSEEIIRVELAVNTLPTDIDLNSKIIDPSGRKLTFKVVSADHGLARLLHNGHTIRFTPQPHYYGLANVRFVASDGLYSATLTQEVCVCPFDTGPVAAPVSAYTAASKPVKIYPLAHASSPDRYKVGLQSVSKPPHGTALIRRNNSADPSKWTVVYIPNAGFHGTDHFRYTVTDFLGFTNFSTIAVTVA